MSTMLMTDIRKSAVGAGVTDLGPALLSLAESAREVLGYDVLEKRMNTTVVVAETTCLRMTLQSLGIEVLVEQDVARYQKEQLIAHTAAKMQEWMKQTGEKGMDDFHTHGLHQFNSPGWQRTAIKEYRQPIPEHILAKAVEVKQQMPECEIWVESLEDHPDPFMIVAGGPPRYSWYKPEEHYYLAAWDEPKFEGRLDSGEAGTATIGDQVSF
jgi:hypothetical protein